MSETKACTCIKPLVIEGRRLSIGDPIELLESQARPLQHGGFITLDTAAGELIRELVREEDETEVDIDLPDSEGPESVTNNSSSESRSAAQPRQATPTQVGFEIGD